eukprot:m.87323 g.87323  ORF g.87323 m.87323 type:complete len:156 (+) comp14905_c0_seq3:191-658(+)
MPKAAKASGPSELTEAEVPFRKQRWPLFFLYAAFCSFMVVAMHAFHAHMGGDPLVNQWFHGPMISIDTWSFMHVMLFFGIGALFPDLTWTIFAYGIVWEILEYGLTFTKGFAAFWQEVPINSIWDLWFNLLGYRLGEWFVFWVAQRRKQAKAKAS